MAALKSRGLGISLFSDKEDKVGKEEEGSRGREESTKGTLILHVSLEPGLGVEQVLRWLAFKAQHGEYLWDLLQLSLRHELSSQLLVLASQVRRFFPPQFLSEE